MSRFDSEYSAKKTNKQTQEKKNLFVCRVEASQKKKNIYIYIVYTECHEAIMMLKINFKIKKVRERRKKERKHAQSYEHKQQIHFSQVEIYFV